MSTVALNIYTDAYPTISNHIEIRIYAQSNPLAVIASLNYAAPHPLRTWSFPGLPRTNYLFRIFEMSGSSIIQQLGGDMDVVPGSSNGVDFRATEQIEADVTTGFTSGLNTFTFNGTAGTEDWRGWEISTIDRIGTGPMKKNTDYLWDKTTGVFTLVQVGDIFAPNEWFNVEFEAQTSSITQSVPTIFPLFASAKIITANYSINAGTDFGALLIVDPPGNYIEITLPDIDTVVELRPVTIEMRRSSANKCCKIITQSGQVIDWMGLSGPRNDLYMCPNETIKIYNFIDTTNPGSPVAMWRIADAVGNFLRVGNQFGDDQHPANMLNVVQFEGTVCDIFQYARLYNDYVLKLPSLQLVNYDDWATGNNKYFFSLANSSNPANANKFIIPDRRRMVDKMTDGGQPPGTFEDAQVGAFNLTVVGKVIKKSGTSNSIVALGSPASSVAGASPDNTYGDYPINVGMVNAGNENRVKSVIGRKYCYA